MTVFITGATGFIGRTLVRKLIDRGETVRALYRSKKRTRFIEHSNLVWVHGHIGESSCLLEGLDGADAVIHLVGILIEPKGASFQKIHVEGTQNVLQAARQAGVRRFLYMSALGTRPHAKSRYHQTKWEAEERVRQSGLDVTLFRPSVVFGPEDVSVNWFAKMVRFFPIVPIPGTGRNRLQPVWVEDVADAMIQSLERPHTIGKTYTLAGPQSYPMDGLFDLLMKMGKKRRMKVHLPVFGLRIPAAIGEAVLPHPPITRDQLIMLQEDNIGENDPAQKDLGLTFHSLEEVLPTYLFQR